MMTDGSIDTRLLKRTLKESGLDEIFSFYLQEERDEHGRIKRTPLNEHKTVIHLEIALEPIANWKKSIGRFYADKRYTDKEEWEFGALKEMIHNDNILSYFMEKQPDFRLCNEDSMLVMRSTVEYLNQITKAGISVRNIAKVPYNPGVVDEITRLTRRIEFHPFILGTDHMGHME